MICSFKIFLIDFRPVGTYKYQGKNCNIYNQNNTLMLLFLYVCCICITSYLIKNLNDKKVINTLIQELQFGDMTENNE
jgi:hypothetical protein